MGTSRRSVISTLGGGLLICGGTGTVQATNDGNDQNDTSESDDQLFNEVESAISNIGDEFYNAKEEDPEGLENSVSQLSAEGTFDLDEFKQGAWDGNRQTYRLQHIAELLNKDFGANIPTSYIDDLNVSTGKISTYLPLVAASQNLIEAGEAYLEAEGEDAIKEAEEELVISILLFVCELCLLQSTATYRLSFSGTRYVANMGLVRFRGILGMRGYALILSEVHWAIRGKLAGVQTTIVEKSASIAREQNLELLDIDYISRDELFELRNLSEDSLDYKFLNESTTNESEGAAPPPMVVSGKQDRSSGFGVVATAIGAILAIRQLLAE
ncbi:hypothetical protein HTZ84_05265 [Haloterrigena sp. SYSU A558-1]|uniref:Uncharacterized protein n=1 Tax=Haloterrigena gelatinilytica TaxID=2741724 RepID=A0ABX2LA08_9EURY|nr:hypothetical protein [Haloterrigena gelatinilytica]NUC71723.1 hypothetical protein [Haloterrigena gelatinilytica]